MSKIFNEITTILYGKNPYLEFEPFTTKDIRMVSDKIFDFLIASLRPQKILEVGTWKGSSAIKMAELLNNNNLEESVIICVDTWLGSPEHWLWKKNKEWGFENLKIVNGFPTIYKTFISNIINSNLQNKIIPFPQTSENAAIIFQKLNLKFDLIYIDAAHEYEPVWRDLQAYYPLLNEKGILFGDDYPRWEGVRQAVNNFAEQFNLNIYSKLGKYILAKPEQNLVGFEIADLKQEAIKSEQEILQLGLKARQQGQEQEALQYFEQAIRVYPKAVSAYLEAGNSLKALQRLEEAKQRFEKALQQKPSELRALMGCAEIEALGWELERALEKFQQIIKHHPNYLNAYMQAAIQLRKLKRFAEAEKITDLGLSKCLTEADTTNLLREKSLALAGQVKLDEASEILKKIFKRGGNWDLFFEAANLLSTLKMFDQAILFLQLNLLFLKEYSDNWILIQRRLEFISRAKYVYETQIEKAKKDEKYKLLDLHPQEPFFKIPLKEFSLKGINQDKPSFFSANLKGGKSQKEFDDLEGLLATEVEILSQMPNFKEGVPDNISYGIFTLPKACFMINWTRLPFSLDGYFIPKLVPILHAFKYSQQCLMKELERRIAYGFFLPSGGQGNYYHIICDIMPTLSVYQELGLDCPIVLPSVAKNVEQIKIILQALDIPQHLAMSAQETEGISFDIGIVCPPIPLSLKTVNFYRTIATKILKQQNVSIKKSERVYISRRNSPKRPLLNEDKLEAILAKIGFSIYYMENYSFEEQITIMANASLVVAPHGAGLTNIFFCPTGTTIVELMMDKYTVSMFYHIALICNHKYYPILGKFEGLDPSKDEDFVWTINLEKVQQVVETLVKSNT